MPVTSNAEGTVEQQPGLGLEPSEGDISAARQDQARPGSSVDDHRVTTPQPVAGATVNEKLSFITAHKLAGNKPVYVTSGGGVNGAGAIVRPATASSGTSSTASQARWVQPSGPRRPGEGTENEEQGIIAADKQPEGGVQLRITLLAAGFIIGPAGATVREIMRITGCDIKSWTDTHAKCKTTGLRRPCRVFIVDGDDEAIAKAIDIIAAAIDRYKELCEGRCQGQSVTRVQKVLGVEFTYQPPPRNVVPFAASLKGNVTRPASRPGEVSLTGTTRGGAGMMSMLPSYLVPIPGPYMSPVSSPGGPAMPFPMYMPQLGTSGYGEGESGAGGDLYGAGGAFDMSSSALRAPGAMSGQQSWAPPMSPYTYPGGVDPASMMAYMSIMMPTSPASRYPGLDASAPLAMPFGAGVQPNSSPLSASSAPTAGGYGATSALRTSSNPQAAGVGAHPYLPSGMAPTADTTGYMMTTGTGAGPNAPYMTDAYGQQAQSGQKPGTATIPGAGDFSAEAAYAATGGLALGPMPMSPYAPAAMPAGYWYPPSPGMAMPMMMPGMAAPAMAGMPPGAHTYYGAAPSRRSTAGSASEQHGHGGPAMSPSRLNPKAQPWGSTGSPPHGHPRQGPGGSAAAARRAASTAAEMEREAAVASHAAAAAMAGRGPSDAEAVVHLSAPIPAAPPAPPPGKPHDEPMQPFHKTPKRVPVIAPSQAPPGPAGRFPGDTTPGSIARGEISPGLSGTQSYDNSGQSGVFKTAAGMSARPTSSSGAASYGLGPGGPSVNPSLVSSDDPLVSPSRFGSKGARSNMRGGRPQAEGVEVSPTGSVNQPEPLRELPLLVNKMSLTNGSGQQAGPYAING